MQHPRHLPGAIGDTCLRGDPRVGRNLASRHRQDALDYCLGVGHIVPGGLAAGISCCLGSKSGLRPFKR